MVVIVSQVSLELTVVMLSALTVVLDMENAWVVGASAFQGTCPDP